MYVVENVQSKYSTIFFKNIIATMLHLFNNIRYIRLLAGKTQTEFGELIGCSKDSVYTYEKGKATPDELILSKISKMCRYS